MECYVCLEECNYKSPCECGSPVHEECLKKIDSPNCTVCKDTLYIEIEEEPEIEDETQTCNYKGILCKHVSVFLISTIITWFRIFHSRDLITELLIFLFKAVDLFF